MQNLVKYSLIALFILTISSSCSKADDFVGSDTVITFERELPSFTKIVADTDLSLEVIQGPSSPVEITTNENLTERVKTTVSDNTLFLSLASGSYSNITVQLKIQIPELDRLELNDSTNGIVSIDQNQLEIVINDAAKLQLEGSAQALQVKNNDAGKIMGFEFVADQLDIRAKDASESEFSCIDALTGNITQAAVVRYKGFPNIDVSTSEDGRIIDAN